ncbi:FecCD family ABC transporter permease [Spirosoma rhododendri]|uniref:Iron ABC transporter permease n=1 Tax=Spirosoma rhododendri TaxID=2728024 RepID=A0A7L5DLV8_9BACT|nr:iron ABC transporter permease [Spirosoma rhododendri]QJD79464.1 iron ABC transporter permease [Spirosoma rhododendri]
MLTQTPPILTTPRASAVRPVPRRSWLLPALAAGLVVTVLLSAGVGAVAIAPGEVLRILAGWLGIATDVNQTKAVILTTIRLPRVCLGMLIGSGLAVAGAAMQGLFRNPLADPGLIGISSGASLAAVLMIVLEVTLFQKLAGLAGYYALSLVAFAGACGTTLLVYRLARVSGRSVVTTMLLAGIAINALAGALTGLLTYMATDDQLRTITFWALGSLGGASWTTVLVLLPFMAVVLIGMPRLAKSLNLLALGESQAAMLGVNLTSLKRQVIILSTLAVGTSVAVAGVIGFVGLVIPHLIRLVAGSDHRRVLTGSALGGAIVLTGADALSRTIVAPAELPIGILTALIGTPVFLWMLIRQRNLG